MTELKEKPWQEEFKKISSLWTWDQGEWENALKFISSLLAEQKQQHQAEIIEDFRNKVDRGPYNLLEKKKIFSTLNQVRTKYLK
jgi:hypothetical protein